MASVLPARSGAARAIQRLSSGLVLLEMTAMTVLLVVMVYAVLTQVISRYVLDAPSPWTEETARYSFVWVCMLGAALGVQRQSHFGFDVAVRALPAMAARATRTLGSCIIFAMVALLAWQGWVLMQLEQFSTGPATDIPMAWVYAAIPTGSLLIMAHILLGLLGATSAAAPINEVEDALVEASREIDRG